MKKTAQNIHATTQKFTEITNVSDNVVILNNNACSIVEVKATNFSLLSAEEQDARLYAYASLLNSLSFSIQIVIISKKLDIGNYLKLLDNEAGSAKNQILAEHIKMYKEFIKELVTVSIVLDKKFYLCIPYSPLEKGAIDVATKAAVSHAKNSNDFIEDAKAALHTKLEILHSQLNRLNLSAKTIGSDELVKLYYEIYNNNSIDVNQINENVRVAIVKKEENK